MSPTMLLVLATVIVIAFLLGMVISAAMNRRTKGEEAPNLTPYYSDEVLEGPRLNRVLAWALAGSAVVAVALPTYWLLEPGRQNSRETEVLTSSVQKGAELFSSAASGGSPNALGCADCHGATGGGGARPLIVSIPRDDIDLVDPELAIGLRSDQPGYAEQQELIATTNEELAADAGEGEAPENVNPLCYEVEGDETNYACSVSWAAPALNTVYYRFSREEIGNIITYGRAGTPMGAWGIAGGGPLTEQKIDSLLDFLATIQLSPDEVAKQQSDAVAAAKDAGMTDEPEWLFEQNCARCHTRHWSISSVFDANPAIDLVLDQGNGAFGPSLQSGATLRQFLTPEDQSAFVSRGSDANAAYGQRGIGSGRMPGFGPTTFHPGTGNEADSAMVSGSMLTEEEINQIVEYERGL